MSGLNYKQWFWTECDELNKDTNFAYGLAEKAWNHQQNKVNEQQAKIDAVIAVIETTSSNTSTALSDIEFLKNKIKEILK